MFNAARAASAEWRDGKPCRSVAGIEFPSGYTRNSSWLPFVARTSANADIAGNIARVEKRCRWVVFWESMNGGIRGVNDGEKNGVDSRKKMIR